MRQEYKRQKEQEEEESVFVSMTDMMVSFLFIFMVLLVFFASRNNPQDVVPRHVYEEAIKIRDKTIEELKKEIAKLKQPNPLEKYLASAKAAQLSLLNQLRDRLKSHYPDLPVSIVPEEGILRFQGEGLFATDSADFTDQKRQIVQALSTELGELLPCYTFSSDKDSSWNGKCNPSYVVIEEVQIEGHTDATGNGLHNLNLSTQRAINTFTTMIDTAPILLDRRNLSGQPVLSVSGYGKMRPVKPNDTAENRATNRRIDLRIIMHSPASDAEIDTIRARLSHNFSKEGAK